MNIVVGYVQSNGDFVRQAGEVRALLACGCQTVRIEAAAAPHRTFKPVLDTVCDFLGPGDQLLVPDITHLGSSPTGAEAFVERLNTRGAQVRLLDVEASDRLVAQSKPPSAASQSGGRVDAGVVRALSADGFGPSQIARKLGVSRMTVWRKLAAAGA
jgi:DNA invertase Pin-like site-specific DNA recombinase